MIRHPSPAIGLLLATVISGCSYDRSFMQMDSNSGLPFFGFQWAVDSGSRPSKSASNQDGDRMAPSLIDLRAPSSLDQPGRDRLDLDAEHADIQTVSMSRKAFASVDLRSKTPDTRIFSTGSAASSDMPIHAIMPNPRSVSAAAMFQNRRAAF